MMEKIYAIAFCCNDTYAQYLPTAIESVIQHASAHKKYEILIVDCGMEARYIDMVRDRIALSPNFTVKFHSFADYLEQNKETFYSVGHFSIATYARFFVPKLMQSPVILYLDVDVCVMCDVADMIDGNDIQNYLIGAIPDVGMEVFRRTKREWIEYINNGLKLKFQDNEYYFNAGILLINRVKWIENDIETKLIDALKQGVKFKYLDQDALNVICHGNVKFLDLKYNFPPFEYVRALEKHRNLKTLDDQTKALVNALISAKNHDDKIIHYITHKKPWNTPDSYMAEKWWALCRLTETYEQCLYQFINVAEAPDRTVKLFAIPIMRIKTTHTSRKYLLLGLNIFQKKIKYDKVKYYLFKIPFCIIEKR